MTVRERLAGHRDDPQRIEGHDHKVREVGRKENASLEPVQTPASHEEHEKNNHHAGHHPDVEGENRLHFVYKMAPNARFGLYRLRG